MIRSPFLQVGSSYWMMNARFPNLETPPPLIPMMASIPTQLMALVTLVRIQKEQGSFNVDPDSGELILSGRIHIVYTSELFPQSPFEIS